MSTSIAKRRTRPARPATADLPVFEVEVFLTNRCNLACSYCSSRHLRDDKEAQKLSFPQLKSFVDLLASDRTIKEKYSGPVRIEFAGGEPLMEFELLRRTVDYIRGRDLDFELSIATNGTLLTPERVDYLARAGVDMRVSLDGLKAVNDRHRVFAHDRNKSVFEAVMKNLRAGFTGGAQRARCNVSPTLNPDNIGTLPEVVRFFEGELGVRKLRVGLEAFCVWPPPALARLRTALRRLVADRLAVLRPGAAPGAAEDALADFPLRQDVRCYRETPDQAVSTLALLYDGYFYPSPDFVVAPPPPEKKYRVGDLVNGIDFAKLERVFRPMLREIDRHCPHRSGPRSPVEGYYWGVVNGYGREGVRDVLRSTSEVNRIFREETDGYMRLHRAFRRLLPAHGFGDLAHAPKFSAPREIRRLRLAAPAGAAPAALRRRLDYFLHSPGLKKTLLLGGGPAETADLAAYALVKARLLGKKLRLELAAGEDKP